MANRGIELFKSLAERFADVENVAKSGGLFHKLFTFDPTKSVDDEKRTVTFTITTGSVDRDNDTIAPTGWDVSDYLKNPVILWAHDYSQLPVARALSIEATGSGLKSTAQFPPKGVHPFADTVFELIKGGFLNASSVGFKPMEYSRDEDRGGINFLRQSMLEWSIVPVPANAEALALASAKGIDVSPVLKWAEDAVVKFGGADRLSKLDARRKDDEKQTCPNCANEFEGDGSVCDSCKPKGVAYGDGTAFVLKALGQGKAITPATIAAATKRNRIGADPMRAKGGFSLVVVDDDPIRWNRSLSKAFDVEGEPVAPSKLEIALVARFLGSQVQEILEASFIVPSAKMGSYLSALDESVAQWKVDATRNIVAREHSPLVNTEAPPVYEEIQLNSRESRSFLVEGIRFMTRGEEKLAVKIAPTWMGIEVTTFVSAKQVDVRKGFLAATDARSAQINYLRGEAFTLSGEFLDRGDLDWSACFLEPKEEKVLRKTVDRINEQGADMDSRGLMLMGPPGTGKTLSGRVMLRQAESTFIWVSARDFYRAGSFGAFEYAFKIAAECAPSILFFEDVDNWLYGTSIDLLKTQMDGLKRSKGVETILTTNFPEAIPDALIDRPGRFHDVLELSLPTEAARVRMLEAWMPTASEVDRVSVAQATDGFSGAHVRELARFAETIAADEKIDAGAALTQALDKIKEQRELIASIKNGHTDYRPSRVTRSLVGSALALVEKRGRILSAVNEGKIRTASASLERATEELSAVLGQLNRAPEVDEDEDEKPEDEGKDVVLTIVSDEADEIAVKIVDEDAALVSPEDVVSAIRASLGGIIASAVREQTASALAKARGRVD